MAKTMSGWSRRRTRYRTAVEAVVWLEDDEADLSVEVVVLSEVGEDHFCAAPGRSAAAAVKCGFGGERGADERSAGGGIGASGRHGLYAPGSGKAARRQRRGVHRFGSKERSSKRDAGLGAWRLSLSVEAACVKTVAIFDGGSRSCDSTALRAATRKRISATHTEKNVAGPGGEVEVEAEAGTAL